MRKILCTFAVEFDKDTLITHLLTLFWCGVEISADNTHLIIKNLAIVQGNRLKIMGNTQNNNFNQPIDYEALPFPKK